MRPVQKAPLAAYVAVVALGLFVIVQVAGQQGLPFRGVLGSIASVVPGSHLDGVVRAGAPAVPSAAPSRAVPASSSPSGATAASPSRPGRAAAGPAAGARGGQVAHHATAGQTHGQPGAATHGGGSTGTTSPSTSHSSSGATSSPTSGVSLPSYSGWGTASGDNAQGSANGHEDAGVLGPQGSTQGRESRTTHSAVAQTVSTYAPVTYSAVTYAATTYSAVTAYAATTLSATATTRSTATPAGTVAPRSASVATRQSAPWQAPHWYGPAAPGVKASHGVAVRRTSPAVHRTARHTSSAKQTHHTRAHAPRRPSHTTRHAASAGKHVTYAGWGSVRHGSGGTYATAHRPPSSATHVGQAKVKHQSSRGSREYGSAQRSFGHHGSRGHGHRR